MPTLKTVKLNKIFNGLALGNSQLLSKNSIVVGDYSYLSINSKNTIVVGENNFVGENSNNAIIIGGDMNNIATNVINSSLVGCSNVSIIPQFGLDLSGNTTGTTSISGVTLLGVNNYTATTSDTVYVPNIQFTSSAGTINGVSINTITTGSNLWMSGTGVSSVVQVGGGNIASGAYSHSEGIGTYASGLSSHAEGSQTTALGNYSHSEGFGTTSIGIYSHAGGDSSVANGNTSFVHGKDSEASGSNTIVLGQGITGATSNTTYLENLNIKSGKVIKTSNGGGQIDLDYGGYANILMLSSDSGAFTNGLFMGNDIVEGTDFNYYTGTTILSRKPTNLETSKINVYDGKIDIGVTRNTGGSSQYISGIYIGQNANTNVYSNQLDLGRAGVLINSTNSVVLTGVTNSVVIGGTNLSATASNTVYTPDINIQTGKVIKTDNGGGQIDLDYAGTPSEILISTDNGAYGESYLDMDSTFASLGAIGGSIYITSNQTKISNDVYIGIGLTTSGGTGVPNITIQDNSSVTTSTPNGTDTSSVFISSRGSKIISGITSSVVIGGTNLTATTSNTVVVPNLEVQGVSSSFLLSRLTTTQRNALTAVNGMLIYNTTLNKFQGYENGAWANLI